MSNRPKSEYNEVYNKWNRFWKTVQSPTLIGKLSHEAGEKIVKSMILDFALPPDASILDLGCGTGITLRIFRDFGFVNSIGIDNAKEAIKICVENGFVLNKDVFEMDALNTPFHDRQFTMVFSWGLLEHFQDYFPFVKEMARLSDRYVLILQPNHFSLAGRISHMLAERLRDNVKEYSYRIEEFIEAFEKVGFNLKVMKTTRFKKYAIMLFERGTF